MRRNSFLSSSTGRAAGSALPWNVVRLTALTMLLCLPSQVLRAQGPGGAPQLAQRQGEGGQGEGGRATAAVVPAAFTSDPAVNVPGQQESKLTKESIAQETAILEAATDLPDELKTETKERLRKASEWLDAEVASKKRQVELESLLPQIPTQLAEGRKSLADFSDADFQAMPTGSSIAELESQLASLRQQVEADESLYRQRETELETRTSRLTTLTKEGADLEQRVTDLRTQIESIKPIDPATRAQQLELRARLQLRGQELITGKLERRRLEDAAELLPVRRDLAKRIWSNRQKMLARWQTSIDNWRKEESKRQAQVARGLVENSHPALKSLAEENAQIAEQRMKTAAQIQRVTELTKQLNKVKKELEDDFAELRDRVEHAGTTSTTGLLLRKKRSELPDAAQFASRATFVQTTMPDAHLQLLEWKRQRREVDDPEEIANKLVNSLENSLADADRGQAVDVLVRMMNDRRELLEKAIPDQDTYLQDLNALELVNQQLRDQVAEFRQYLNQRVLWIRSTDMISASDLYGARDGLASVMSPSRWIATLRVGGGAILKRPVVAVGLLAVVILLIMFRARLHSTQQRLVAPPPPGQPAHYGPYFAAFGISVLLSARWPALLLAIGYRLKVAADGSDWTASVGNALITSVGFLWGCELIRELCRRDAIGERVFGWPAKATATIRTTLELTILCGTPLFALLQLTQFGEVDEMQSLQRVLFIAILGLLGVQLAGLTRPQGVLMSCVRQSAPSSLVVRGRYAIWFSVTAAPLAFVILSITGYHFSAYQLSGHLAETAAMLVGIIVVHSLSLSWLHVMGYNRSLREAAAVAESQTDSLDSILGSVTADTDVAPADKPAAPINPDVDSEVRDLLRYACMLLLVVGGWFIWSEVLPALRVFDNVVLWQNIEPIAETIVNTDGTESIRIVDQTVPTTLTDLMVAMLVCVATMLIGRRIPGVVELTVLEHLPMEQGGRQAISIIVRYVATVAGILVACNVIRLSWSSVQWLAAAMTVGLGFGLQEIFANLVSGLIILVERPIRVGDIVTVGDVTGTVSRMQMRATTVTDYDRRELIVPNKKFITDNVINWTLSDPISRIVLPVGVAYGTDVNKVRKILLRIAFECPFVLTEPAPNTLFKGFGDSTLNVQLMVFIPQRSVYLEVVNELNGAIAREFAAADIQIAFPQLDLHFKTDQALSIAAQATDRAAA